MGKIERLNNLNDISGRVHCGVYKRWMYKNNDYHKVCDFMQKINFCVQDLNEELKIIDKLESKDIVYIVSLVDWIKDAYEMIEKCIGGRILNNFRFKKEEELKQVKDFFTAIRSFVVAHPSSTNRHGKFGLDGDFVCTDIDIKIKPFLELLPEKTYYTLSINGIENKKTKCDFYLHSYSEKADKMRFMKFIGCNLNDIYLVARLYIEKLYELDKYLVKNIKRKDYV